MSARPLLVCLDLQRAFIEDGPMRAPNAAAALLECGRLLSLARREHWSIAHCYLRSSVGPVRIEAGSALPVHGFEPRSLETVIERDTLSAYGHAAFKSLVQNAPFESALIAGLSASITFLATAFDAFREGHRFVLAADALAGQGGFEASASQHEAVARDVAAQLGFPTAPQTHKEAKTLRQPAPPLVFQPGEKS